MYTIGALALLAAIFTDTQVPPDKTTYGGGCGCGGSQKKSYGATACGCQKKDSVGTLGVGTYATAPTSMPGFGAEPGSWEAAWKGDYYGFNTDPITQRIEQINHAVMGIIKQILGWAVATKGPRLMSLNSQRDELIRSGAALGDPRVTALEVEAMQILRDRGVSPQQEAQLNQLKAERDHLLRQKAGIA
jgi:hypothetical protein